MKWSPQQSKVLTEVADWIRAPDQPFYYLGGYAGTGKTTLAKHLAQDAGHVEYAAYTGKAALQLRKSGIPVVSTVHSLIYKLQPPERAKILEMEAKLAQAEKEEEQKEIFAALKKLKEPHFVLNDESALDSADLLVLDECSMINKEMAEDLLSFEVPILILGDPGQLPPVKGEGYFTANEPDSFLTEIHRQALENPIIAASMAARERGIIPYFEGDEVVRLRDREELKEAMLVADKVMVGKNVTRQGVNRAFRSHRGFTSQYPEVGDELICLKNYSDKGLFNGLFCKVTVADPEEPRNFRLYTDLETELGNKIEDLPVFSGIFDDYNTPKASEKIPYYARKGAKEFDYGYAITVHKSQGSQYPSAFLWDDGMFTWDRGMRKKWLYTAVTRAADKFTWAEK